MLTSHIDLGKFRAGEHLQREWGFGGQRKWRDGLLLLAFFFGGVGAGQFLISTLLIKWPLSALIGLLIVLIGKGAAHILYLGRPSRFWRIFFRPQTSWISRGLIFMTIFVIFGALYLAPDLGFDWLPWSSTSATGIVLWIIAAFASLCMMVYDGFLLMSGRSIPSWHNGIIPLLFAIYSLDSGIAITSTLSALSGKIETVAEATYIDTLVLLAVLASLGVYLLSMAGISPAARLSLRDLLRGGVAPFFIGGTIIAGVVVPLILIYLASSISYLELALNLIAVAGILALLGDLFVRHSILKVGYHLSPI